MFGVCCQINTDGRRGRQVNENTDRWQRAHKFRAPDLPDDFLYRFDENHRNCTLCKKSKNIFSIWLFVLRVIKIPSTNLIRNENSSYSSPACNRTSSKQMHLGETPWRSMQKSLLRASNIEEKASLHHSQVAISVKSLKTRDRTARTNGNLIDSH